MNTIEPPENACAEHGEAVANSRTTGSPLPFRPLLTVKDVATLLNVSLRTVEDIVASKGIVPIRVKGRIRRFAPEQVEAYLRSVTDRAITTKYGGLR